MFVTHEETQTRRFHAYDDSGNLHVIIGKRDAAFTFGRVPRFGKWRYQMEDGSPVEPGDSRSVYLINDGTILLHTSDPREPGE